MVLKVIHTYTTTQTHTPHANRQTGTHTYICIYVRMNVCMNVCVRVSLCLCACIGASLYVCIFICRRNKAVFVIFLVVPFFHTCVKCTALMIMAVSQVFLFFAGSQKKSKLIDKKWEVIEKKTSYKAKHFRIENLINSKLILTFWHNSEICIAHHMQFKNSFSNLKLILPHSK